MAESLHADRACSVHSGVDVKWSAVEVYKRIRMKREITGRERARPERTLPYWVAALIQQQTDPKTDHLSPLWSPYKSSTFPLFSYAAHKLIKLAFPCCFWQMEGRETSSEVYCGWSKAVRTNACGPTHVPHTVQLRQGLPQNCYSYQNDTWAAFAYSWINAAEGELVWDVCTSHEPSHLVLGSVGSVVPHNLFLSGSNDITMKKYWFSYVMNLI